MASENNDRERGVEVVKEEEEERDEREEDGEDDEEEGARTTAAEAPVVCDCARIAKRKVTLCSTPSQGCEKKHGGSG
jgi:hypothetical protein